MWRNSAMAEPSTGPGASGKFTRRKLGEKLYLPSSGFNLRDPNCHLLKPTYHSLHDPNLKQHFYRPDIHKKLIDQNLITNDDMVICTRKEYTMYKEYVEDIKNDVTTSQLRERKKKLLELEEQGLISEDMSLEDIREFLQNNELPSLDKHQHHAPGQIKQNKSTKNTMKEKDASLNGQFPNIMMQSTEDKTRLQLNEREVKHQFSRNKHLREVQRKIHQRENAILERRAAAKQAEINEIREHLRVTKVVRTKLNSTFSESTLVKASQNMLQQRRQALERLVPLPVKQHNLEDNQQTSSGTILRLPSDADPKSPFLGKVERPIKQHNLKDNQQTSSGSKSGLPSDTDPKSPFLGKVKLPTIQHDPAVNKDRITKTALNSTMSSEVQSQGETTVETISSPTVKREDIAGGPLYRRKAFGYAAETQKTRATPSSDIYPPKVDLPSPSPSCNVLNIPKPQTSLDVAENLASRRKSSVTCSPSEDTTISVASEQKVVHFQQIGSKFSEVKEQLATKFKEESTKREVSPLGPPCHVADIKANEGGSVTSHTAEPSAPGISPYESESPADASAAHSGPPSSLSNSEALKTEEHQQVTPHIAESPADASAAFFDVPSSLSHSEILKMEEFHAVSSQKKEVSTSEISPNEFESPANASAALFGVSHCLMNSKALKTGEDEVSLPEVSQNEFESPANASAALSFVSSSLSNLEALKTDEHQPASSQKDEALTPEISLNELESPANASAALPHVSSSLIDSKAVKAGDYISSTEISPSAALSVLSSFLSNSEALKTDEHQPASSHKDEVFTSDFSSYEFESPANASAALSSDSSLSNSKALKTEEHQQVQSVPSQEDEFSSPEISLPESESPANASAALSGIPSSLSNSETLKTEELHAVCTPEISSNEFESQADASAALSGVSSSLMSSKAHKTEEDEFSSTEISPNEFKSPADACAALSVVGHQPVTSQKHQVSAPGISTEDVETLAGASEAPSRASCHRNVDIFKAEGSQPVTAQEFDKVEMLKLKLSIRKKKCTAMKIHSLPSLYPAVADEISKYFTSFKDNISQVVKKELKRSFSVNDLPSKPHSKLGPEEKKAIRSMLKRVSKELEDLMSREHILSLLSAAETNGRSSPEHDTVLEQLNAVALRLIDEVYDQVRVKFAAELKQESPKRGVSPVANEVAMAVACRSLEKIKTSLIGDDVCVASTSRSRLSVSSDDTKASSLTSKAGTLGTTSHVATPSLSLPNIYSMVVKGFQQHVSSESFKDHVHQVVRKEYKRSLSMNDVTPAPHKTLGREERHFIKDKLSTFSRELSALLSTHSSSHLSPMTTRPSSASEEDILRRLNEVALELIHSVYAQVKEKLIVAIKEESPKRGLSPVASQTAVDAACRTLSAIEMSLMDGVGSPSTSPLLLEKSEDLEYETASEESLEIQTSSSSIFSDDLIDDVLSMFCVDTDLHRSISSSISTASQWAGGSALFNEEVNMAPTDSKAYSTATSDVRLTVGPLTPILPRITDEILEQLSNTCFKDCVIQSVKNDIRQRVSGVSQDSRLHIRDIMEVIVKNAYQKMALLIIKTAPDSLIVEDDMSKPGTTAQTALGVEDTLSTQELASAIKQITIAVLNHLKIQLCDQNTRKHRSLEETELVTHAVNNTLGVMVEYVSNIQFFNEELHCYVSWINQIPTQKLIGQWIPASKLDLVSTCLATTVIDNVYSSDYSLSSSSQGSPEPEANSPVSDNMMSPSKPENPSTSRSFRARKWLSSSALENTESSTNPVTIVQSKSLEFVHRTNIHIDSKDKHESSSKMSMSTSSVTSQEGKGSRVCSPHVCPSSQGSPEPEANSSLSDNMMSPSKPASPSTSRSFRARKWLSSSALEKSESKTNPVTTVQSQSLESVLRTDMHIDNKDKHESSSKKSMSTSSATSQEGKGSRGKSPRPNTLARSRATMNIREKMHIGLTLKLTPPCNKSNTAVQLLPNTRRVIIRTIFSNSEVFSDDESSSTSCSIPDDIQSDDAASSDECPSLSPRRARSM